MKVWAHVPQVKCLLSLQDRPHSRAFGLLMREPLAHLRGQLVEDQPDPPLRRLPEQRSRHLRERAAEGSWIEPWINRPSNLRRDEIVGYEALTRFTDGSIPEVLFDEAAAVGLGHELETATLHAALEAAESLPQSAWLNLNSSPELILAGEPLRTLLGGSRRHIVLEVTEHTAITDYPAFRAAMAALGPSVEFAVDDAGTGFASLRHIVELRPTFVKLDRSLMAGLESDEARQAMIVGICHFAHVTGCRLIVEGIETDSELTVLRALTIELGQGYLLGRPLPVDNIQVDGQVVTRA
jgi:EAL domain-containing protein (putative c-di-GMP-specific phosphodiesterase class I)